MTYVMSSKMYHNMTHNDEGRRIRGKQGVIEVINNSFGLKGKVEEIQVR